MAPSVLTQHNNSSRTGHFKDEDLLNWNTVDVSTFGKITQHDVHGIIWAQPLYVPFVAVPKRGVHNIIIIATADNWVYAFDAEAVGNDPSAMLWSNKIGKSVPSCAFRPDYGDMYRTNVGILSTPVIDASVGTRDKSTVGNIILVAMVWDPDQFDDDPEKAISHLLVSLDLSTGKLTREPVVFSGRAPGSGYLEAENSARRGLTSNRSPPTRNAVVQFELEGSARELRFVQAAEERNYPKKAEPGLYGPAHIDVAKKKLYVEAEITRDLVTAENAVQGWDERRVWPIQDGVLESEGKRFVVFNSMQQLQRAGLLLDRGLVYSAFASHGDFDPWHGWIFAHDATTLEQKAVFCTSMNGRRAGVWQAGEGLCVDEQGKIFAATGNGDISPASGCYGDSLLKLNFSKGGLELEGFLNAFEELATEDLDFGSSTPTLLPDGFLAGGGKDGNFVLVNPSSMTPSGNPSALKQIFLASYDDISAKTKPSPPYSHHIHGSPIVYEDEDGTTMLFVWGENDYLRCFKYSTDSHEFPDQPNRRNEAGRPTAIGMTCASADGPPDCMLGGFLAASSHRGKKGSGIVWASFPPFDNASQSAVHGELRAYRADDFYKGRLVTLWSSRFNSSRDDGGSHTKFCCPTIAGGRVFVSSAGRQPALVVYGLLSSVDGGYDIGFGGKSRLTLNGNSTIVQKKIRLTESRHKLQAGSMFHRELQPIQRFVTTFTVTCTGWRERPDRENGFTFTIQNESAYALGGAGASFGYGPDDRGTSVKNSIGLAFGIRYGTLSLVTNGDSPTAVKTERPAGVDLTWPTEIMVSGTSEGLVVELRDLVHGFKARHQLPVHLFAYVEHKAYVGFTAGSSASGCTVDLQNWQFHSEEGNDEGDTDFPPD